MLKFEKVNGCQTHAQGIAVVACILWTRKNDTIASNGQFFGWHTESSCMDACLESMSCVAVDIGPLGCVMHHNAKDLTQLQSWPGVTHFALDRQCLPAVTTGIHRCSSARALVIAMTIYLLLKQQRARRASYKLL